MKYLLTICLLLLVLKTAFSQDAGSTLNCETVVPEVPVNIGGKSIVLNTLSLPQGYQFSLSLDSSTMVISRIGNESPSDSVRFCYRSLPKFLTTKYKHKDTDLIDSTYAEPVDRYSIFKPKVESQKLFETGDNLQSGGRISRGITFGNSNDLSVQSMLNLSLDGQLADDLFITAVITDQNIPFQPEGNTAQLQELDNVYIKLYNQNFGVQAGDLILRNKQPSRFLKYFKNVQGAGLNVTSEYGETAGAVTFAKGKFASVAISPIDGIQGPYRIPGPDGENFVVVWANSERVYVDGQLLKRGFNNDYIIDYNLGEVTFNSNIVITQFSRIRIDYEFSANAYSRSILQAGHTYEGEKFSGFFNIYREADNRNKPVEEMSDDEKLLLSELGDNLDSAVVSGADSVGFSSDEIRYKKTTLTATDGQNIEIFQYSTDPDSAVYRVVFSYVGENKGRYRRGINTANGRVYEWSEPSGGFLTGDYEPYRKLRAPDKKEMVNFGGSYKIDHHNELLLESSISNRDNNTFSTLDDQSNTGGSIFLGYRLKEKSTGLGDYKLSSDLNVEYLSKTFSPIDRIREIEFDRDWSYRPEDGDSLASDLVINVGASLVKNASNQVRYNLTKRSKGILVDGFQHRMNINQEIWKVRFKSDNFLLNSHSEQGTEVLQSNWLRSRNEISLNLKPLVPGYVFTLDQNTIKNGDSIQFTQMYFEDHTFFITNHGESKHKYRLSYSIRDDQSPVNGDIAPFLKTKSIQLKYEKSSTNGVFKSIFTYRDVQDVSEQGEGKNWKTMSGRLDWNRFILKKIIQNDFTYTISNSRDLKREFVFVQVPTGQGDYTWNDLNEDGIKDLNEFFLALNPDERNYAKIWIPTNDYIDAFDNTLTYRFNLKFPMSWKRGSSIERLVYRFSNNTSWTSSSKTTSESTSDRLLGFLSALDDPNLLSARRNFRTTFFFNRDNQKFGISASLRNTAFKNLLTGGQDLFSINEINSNIRYRILKQYIFNIGFISGNEISFSDLLIDRNFTITNKSVQPKISWQPRNNLRFSVKYTYENKYESTSAEDNSSSFFNQIESAVRFNKINKGYLSGMFSYTSVLFEGVETSPVGIALLKGKSPGDNFDWNLVWQQSLIKGLQLQLGYNGRKNGDASVIHMGRVQVSALF